MSLREIIFDTETTGFDPFSGDRLIEIGCIEMIDKVLVSGKTFHEYCHPERDIPESAQKIHGISLEMLTDKPKFHEIAQAFLDFVGDDSILVAHNADFDIKFVNWELENAGLAPLPRDRFKDTLALARAKFPGSPNSLDALCRRFGVENGHRSLHGALLDSEILADVYIELEGGRQAGLALNTSTDNMLSNRQRKPREARCFPASESELSAHQTLIDALQDPVWRR